VTSVLSSSAGATLVSTLGCKNADEVKLTELTVIVAEPGCEGQALHSDAEFQVLSARSHAEDDARVVTMFLPLHDILAEDRGPTLFVPNTHHPRCFPDNQWAPPTAAGAMSSRLRPESSSTEREVAVWFGPLYSGDLLLMQSTTWHRGGANTSNSARTTLAASFSSCTSDS
jgi:ectoine hydroxylase-related dioxygenase (phytanoyl-CoA dioxygenase family)